MPRRSGSIAGRPAALAASIVALMAACAANAPTPASPAPLAMAPEESVPDTVLWLSREQMVDDVGDLIDFYERTHPDPYASGGKLAYHRAVHELLRDLPESGLSRDDFHTRLQPLVAGRGDAHTRVHPLRGVGGGEGRAGLPIDFRILAVDADGPVPGLFVQGISGVPTSYAGSRLESLAGVPIARIMERERVLEAYENESGNLNNLVWRLKSEKGLRELLPSWDPGDSVRVGLRLPSGARVELHVRLGPVPRTWEGDGIGAGQLRIELPPTKAGVPAYRFVDEERKTALLRMDNTWAHREIFEPLIKSGSGSESWARSFYRSYQGTEAPADIGEVVRALPAATDIFEQMVKEMKDAGTQTLVVDLRRNPGGSSVLVNMLLYYLHGRQGWKEFFGQFYTIRRLTPTDLQGAGLDPATAGFPTRVGDYDFSSVFATASQTASEAGREGFLRRTTIGFARELETSEHEAYYAPPRIIAVVAPATFSGGFWVAASLWRLGAQLVGVPSGQAGNAFANVQNLTLSHSGITVGVSSRQFVMFPEEPGLKPVLPVDAPLTYEFWRDAGWDPNAAILLALHAAARPR